MSERTKISVAVITYNQESTIRQTLDSILAQKGDFDLEVVIGEDCSTDATHAICEEYALRFNELAGERISELESKRIVKLLPNTHNLGIMANTARVFEASTGDFISIIAGDDYYCDDHALEKQLTYMFSHPEVGVMAANGYLYYIRSNKKVPGLNPVFDSNQEKVKEYYFAPTHFEGVCLTPTGMMFRAELLHKYIDLTEILRRKLPVEDYPIQAILSQHTHFACLPDLLVVYRVYKESASYVSYNHPRYLEYYKGLMETRRYLNELFPNNACITEEQLQEKMFAKEFYYDVYHWKYDDAKHLVISASKEIIDSKIVKIAKRFTSSKLLFALYHYYKKNIVNRSKNKYET